MTTSHHPCPGIATNLRSIDWILSRLVTLRERFPSKARELAPRIDAALDERIRLMRLRDLAASTAQPFPDHRHN